MPKAKPFEFYVDENGCHICTSHPSGKMRVNGKVEHIFRVRYIERFGEPEEDKHIYRVCGNNRCINPEHMKAMTQSEFEQRPIEFIVDENGCHICTSHKPNEKGYVYVNGVLAHRLVYEQQNGKIPKGYVIVKKCENRACINPKHMELISKAELNAKLVKENLARSIEYEVDENGCHNCTSHSLDSKGYPRIMVNKKSYKIHRLIYELKHGKIPKGLVVRHKCDNRRCINPDHLEIGTQYDNVHDMIKRGRKVQVRGEASGTAKLTEKDVREIRRRLDAGERYSVLAKMYGVTEKTISDIKLRKTWNHID